MGLFHKKPKQEATAVDVVQGGDDPGTTATERVTKRVAPQKTETELERDFVLTLPPLSIDDLRRFAYEGRQVQITRRPHAWFTETVEYGFYYRLQLSIQQLLLKFQQDEWEHGALLQVAGAARTYRETAKLGRKVLLRALQELDQVQASPLSSSEQKSDE